VVPVTNATFARAHAAAKRTAASGVEKSTTAEHAPT